MAEFIRKDVKDKLKLKWKVFIISAPIFKWVEELKDFLINKYAIETPVEEAPSDAAKMKIYDLKESHDVNDYRIIDLWDMKFELVWERIEQIARMTNMQNFEATMRVYDVMKKISVIKKIEHILNTKYKEQTELRYFEWDDQEDIIPKVYISWRCFPLDRVLFWN
jgi:hypothetical protein